MLATAAFLAVRAKLASREREKTQENEQHLMGLEDHRVNTDTRPLLVDEEHARNKALEYKANSSSEFAVGSVIRVRDVNGQWQSGKVMSLDADGTPLVKVLGYDSVLRWDEYCLEDLRNSESSDSTASTESEVCDDPSHGKIFNIDEKDNDKKSSGGWKAWFRRGAESGGLDCSSNQNDHVEEGDFSGQEPESMKEYFRRMKKKREDRENSSPTSKTTRPHNSCHRETDAWVRARSLCRQILQIVQESRRGFIDQHCNLIPTSGTL